MRKIIIGGFHDHERTEAVLYVGAIDANDVGMPHDGEQGQLVANVFLRSGGEINLVHLDSNRGRVCPKAGSLDSATNALSQNDGRIIEREGVRREMPVKGDLAETSQGKQDQDGAGLLRQALQGEVEDAALRDADREKIRGAGLDDGGPGVGQLEDGEGRRLQAFVAEQGRVEEPADGKALEHGERGHSGLDFGVVEVLAFRSGGVEVGGEQVEEENETDGERGELRERLHLGEDRCAMGVELERVGWLTSQVKSGGHGEAALSVRRDEVEIAEAGGVDAPVRNHGVGAQGHPQRDFPDGVGRGLGVHDEHAGEHLGLIIIQMVALQHDADVVRSPHQLAGLRGLKRVDVDDGHGAGHPVAREFRELLSEGADELGIDEGFLEDVGEIEREKPDGQVDQIDVAQNEGIIGDHIIDQHLGEGHRIGIVQQGRRHRRWMRSRRRKR